MLIRIFAAILLVLVAAAGLLTIVTQDPKSKVEVRETQAVITPKAAQKELPVAEQFGSMIFDKIAEDPNMILEFERNSLRSIIDGTGGLLAGGITRIVMKNPVTKDVFFVNAVVAVCGYNSLMILRSKTFDKNGVMTDELKETQVLTSVTPDSVAGFSYTFLCGKAKENLKPEEKVAPVPMPPVPTPPAPGYTPNNGYKSGWI